MRHVCDCSCNSCELERLFLRADQQARRVPKSSHLAHHATGILLGRIDAAMQARLACLWLFRWTLWSFERDLIDRTRGDLDALERELRKLGR